MTENLTNQLIGVKSGRNFRELGGYKTTDGKTVKMHKLLRTANLGTLDATDLKFLHDYGVKYIVDFRSQAEVDHEPDRIPEGAEYDYDPVFSEDLTNASRSIEDVMKQGQKNPHAGFEHMLFAYDDMITSEAAQKAYRRFFDLLLANDEDGNSLIFHCTAGKDRTGVGALLILTALGVPLDTIKQDYLLTNVATADFVKRMLEQAKEDGADDATLNILKDFQTVHVEYIEHVLTTINEKYGSVNNYLRDIMKLTDAEISKLRKIYLK
ncbi:tyrosine-protein phosphatase [Lactobacillus sp. ESL0731]|uniref:tyrosine-protein phosphatase n=1 Tax=unclassified Lactobacillus TaxID=2620435 RepID=UPI0023F97FE4|nr:MULTISPECIES: tyrosine-protein phosphatase [unclassified Lactobacillus]WEV51007.1 tyrosine-protein phosphatase [Lactobacillus sp. ESL0700]WEV62138.1 tyrosine-protein phosphatase [Lactobacillus sp. ESL0731]